MKWTLQNWKPAWNLACDYFKGYLIDTNQSTRSTYLWMTFYAPLKVTIGVKTPYDTNFFICNPILMFLGCIESSWKDKQLLFHTIFCETNIYPPNLSKRGKIARTTKTCLKRSKMFQWHIELVNSVSNYPRRVIELIEGAFIGSTPL